MIRARSRLLAALTLTLAPVLALPLTTACLSQQVRAAVSLSLQRGERTPRDASVLIDEQYIGPLSYVAAHGVRLPVGTHRITVQKQGYFPWDRLVEADRDPIFLNVELERVPD
jgi:hypothetical protein